MVSGVPPSAKVFVLFVVLIVAVLVFAPLAVVAATSLSDSTYLIFPPQALTLRWYGEIFSTPRYLEPAILSLKLALVVTCLSTVIGTAAAIALGKYGRRSSELLMAFLLSPLIMPVLIFGIGLLMTISILGASPGFWWLTVGHLAIALPYVVRAVGAVLSGADPSLEEAARTMGARAWQCYLYVLLPQCRRGMIAGAFFSFNISFDDAVVALFLQSQRLETLPVRIYSELEYGATPAIAAVSTVMVIITILLLFAIERTIGTKAGI